MFLVPLLAILFIIWVVFYIAGSASSHSSSHNNDPRGYTNNQGYSLDRSLEILRERYAKGEITDEEFQRIKRNLER
jgi:putative membrane protein